MGGGWSPQPLPTSTVPGAAPGSHPYFIQVTGNAWPVRSKLSPWEVARADRRWTLKGGLLPQLSLVYPVGCYTKTPVPFRRPPVLFPYGKSTTGNRWSEYVFFKIGTRAQIQEEQLRKVGGMILPQWLEWEKMTRRKPYVWRLRTMVSDYTWFSSINNHSSDQFLNSLCEENHLLW
jgi:hypothetical protein